MRCDTDQSDIRAAQSLHTARAESNVMVSGSALWFYLCMPKIDMRLQQNGEGNNQP